MPVGDDERGRHAPFGTLETLIESDARETDHAGHHDVLTTRRRAASFGADPQRRSAADGVRRFVQRYGWRAYALPVLVVITVIALVTAGASAKTTPKAGPAQPVIPTTHTGQATDAGPPVAASNIPLKADQPSAGSLNTALPADALPAGGSYTLTGNGTFHVLPGTSPVVGPASGALSRYDVEVEGGITGIDTAQFATMVQSVLSDKRSWAGHAGVALERVDSGPVDFHVTLVSSMTVRTLCGYSIPIETSCYDPAGNGNPVNRVVLNDSRWVRGDAAYVGDLNSYRIYMINHEDGHALGHEHAHECLPGGLAPVMMQQTIGLKSAATGALCEANPWPYPTGVTGTPGAEQPDTPQNSQFQSKND